MAVGGGRRAQDASPPAVMSFRVKRGVLIVPVGDPRLECDRLTSMPHPAAAHWNGDGAEDAETAGYDSAAVTLRSRHEPGFLGNGRSESHCVPSGRPHFRE